MELILILAGVVLLVVVRRAGRAAGRRAGQRLGGDRKDAPLAAYIVIAVIMAVVAAFFFLQGSEPIGTRDLPGWVLGLIAAFASAASIVHVVRRQLQGSSEA